MKIANSKVDDFKKEIRDKNFRFDSIVKNQTTLYKKFISEISLFIVAAVNPIKFKKYILKLHTTSTAICTKLTGCG